MLLTNQPVIDDVVLSCAGRVRVQHYVAVSTVHLTHVLTLQFHRSVRPVFTSLHSPNLLSTSTKACTVLSRCSKKVAWVQQNCKQICQLCSSMYMNQLILFYNRENKYIWFSVGKSQLLLAFRSTFIIEYLLSKCIVCCFALSDS